MHFDHDVRARQSWLMVALAVCALGATACSSSNGGKDAAAGGHGGGSDAGGGGGQGGTGGSQADAGLDAPMSDAPAACIPDGGDASGDCCPDDPAKTQPGQCGCGVPDTDTDGDGVADCIDGCPGDQTKTAPGACGCFLPDTDTDGDGVPDCIDLCPLDRNRSQYGLCGCGRPDTAPLCLAHRYSFNDGTPADGGAGDAGAADGASGAGTTTVADSVGGANGTAVGVVLTGTGSVTLAGAQTDQHINLPSGIISSLGLNATIEAWITWGGGGFWQRIFDFGASDGGDGNQGLGQSWLYCTPQGGPAPGVLWTSALSMGLANDLPGLAILPAGTMQQVVVVVDSVGAGGDAGGPTISLYLNGVLQTQGPLTNPLPLIHDVNNWLGKSQFILDPEFSGTYHEFRIYSAARTADQVMASFQAGPDALPAQ